MNGFRRLFAVPAPTDRPGDHRRRWLLGLLCLLLWTLAVGAVGLYYAKAGYGPELLTSYLANPLLFWLNVLPGVLLALLLLLLTNRVWPGVLVSGLAVVAAALVNYYKIILRNEPFIARDLGYISEAANMTAGAYRLEFHPSMFLCAGAIVAATVLAALLLKARFRRGLPRLLWGAALLAAGAGLYFGVYANDEIYKETANLDVVFADGYQMSQWNDTDQFCSRGFVYPFLHSTADLGPKKPAGYAAKAAQALLAQKGGADIPPAQKINFISVMLEAYADFSEFPEQIRLVSDPYAFFHQLQAEGVSGSLLTNIFAGGTIDTERCYISGAAELYEYRAPAESYARWFNGQGYFTEFCHPGSSWFYDRRNVAEYLGFQRSHFYDTDYHPGEDFDVMRDTAFFPLLLDSYRAARAAEDRPYFGFSVTYQNHGPYADSYLYDPTTEYAARDGMSEASYNILNNYLWGLKLTDDALRDFVAELRNDSEPVVLVLFGDHKPWLGDNGSVYSELGIDLSCRDGESFGNEYRTPYVIWANDAAKAALGQELVGDGGDISPCFLMMKVFDACGYTGDGYMAALRALYGQVQVVQAKGIFQKDGETLSELPADAAPALAELQQLQYYRMRDAMR